MFGRVRRAALAVSGDTPIEAYGLLHAFSPEQLPNAIAAGMGAGAFASGAGMVRLPDGRFVSAVGEAIDSLQRAGRSAAHLYVSLPGHVLVVVTAGEVRLWRWNTASILGSQVAHWPKGTFTATYVHYSNEDGLRLVLDSGLIALLTGTAGHPQVEKTLEAIRALAK